MQRHRHITAVASGIRAFNAVRHMVAPSAIFQFDRPQDTSPQGERSSAPVAAVESPAGGCDKPYTVDGWHPEYEEREDGDGFHYGRVFAVHEDGRRVMVDVSRFCAGWYGGWFEDYIAAGLPSRHDLGRQSPLTCSVFRELAKNKHKIAIMRWHSGVDAYERGEMCPADPDASDGWYYAENAKCAEAILGRFA